MPLSRSNTQGVVCRSAYSLARAPRHSGDSPAGKSGARQSILVEDFLIARNPDGDSKLPYLLRIPLGPNGIVLKARDMWPRTAKIFCHREAWWPTDAEIIERVPVRSCVRRGAAIDLVLDRARENRSQFVLTRIRGGREAIFWQSARTAKLARPNVSLPSARAHGLRADEFEIIVDSHERYAWKFTQQQVSTRVAPLTAGDYGVVRDPGPDEQLVASVERKSLADLVSTLTSGRLTFVLADLASLPYAAIVVEARYSEVLKLDRVRPAVVLEGLAECAVRFPSVPIHFCENRSLAQEWTFRFLGAALAQDRLRSEADAPMASLVPAATPRAREVREWALAHGIPVSATGRVAREVTDAFLRSRAQGPGLD